MNLRKATLKTFDALNYTATIQLTGSYKTYLDGIPVARNIASGEMSAGRNLAVIFFDSNNSREAVVIAVYS